MKPTQTCILVADDHIAKFFVNRGPGKGLEALPKLSLTREIQSSSSGITDHPGRVYDIAGEGRHAIEPKSDKEQKHANSFLKLAVRTLEQELGRNAFDRFIVVAPPRAMSEVRRILPPLLRHNLRAELVKDLTHVTTDELSHHLDEVFPVSALRK